MPSSEPTIGVLGAMPSEVQALVAAMTVEASGTTAGFRYWAGRLSGRPVVVAQCGMGKVSAAMGVQHLIDHWDASPVVVCGLAGGLSPHVRVGDIVVGEAFVQHDLDASPIYPRFEVPGLGVARFEATPGLAIAAEDVARQVATTLSSEVVETRLVSARDPGVGSGVSVHRGLIVTGDQFIDGPERFVILKDFPEALCVEMEGGAIAQVCQLNSVPFLIVRVISDTADGDAPADFLRFVTELAPAYTVRIVQRIVETLPAVSTGP
jgi:adenosylhomocysteine nucleosidase